MRQSLSVLSESLLRLLHSVSVLVLSVEMTYHGALQGVGEAFQEPRATLHVNDEDLCVS